MLRPIRLDILLRPQKAIREKKYTMHMPICMTAHVSVHMSVQRYATADAAEYFAVTTEGYTTLALSRHRRRHLLLHVHTRAIDMPSAMPRSSRYRYATADAAEYFAVTTEGYTTP